MLSRPHFDVFPLGQPEIILTSVLVIKQEMFYASLQGAERDQLCILSFSVYCEFGAWQEWLKQSEIC